MNEKVPRKRGLFVVSIMKISIVYGAVVIGYLYFPATNRPLSRALAFIDFPTNVAEPESVERN